MGGSGCDLALRTFPCSTLPADLLRRHQLSLRSHSKYCKTQWPSSVIITRHLINVKHDWQKQVVILASRYHKNDAIVKGYDYKTR